MLLSIGLACLAAAVAAADGPEAAVRQGRLRGRLRTTKGNRTFAAFEGIPYAEPPLGPLRFKAPLPVESWEGVKDATQPHNICPQRDIYRRSTLIEGDEDCLYLNVYTPQTHDTAKTLFPVMVFFHGGGWLCGGGNSFWYGPDFFLDRDVVLVVPNYRLGPLGFLSTGDSVVPGNNGMKDQNLAMRWVKDNIRSFGGDPDKISIFGESAGGASVQLHMVSPLSKGLFHNGISQSGTAHCLWAVSPNDQTVRNSKLLAKEFGCGDSSSEMVECLRKVPAYDLIAKDQIFMKWDTDPMIPFKPVVEPNVEGAFLVEHPIKSIKKGHFEQVPWIVGLNAHDGALRSAGIFGNPHLIDEFEEKFDEIVPMSLEYDETSTRIDEITKKIKDFYFGGAKVNVSSRSDVTDMYTDGWFLHGADEAVRYYLKYSKKPVYYYLFGHRGPASFTEIFGDQEQDYGVCHADELQYLFPVGDGLFPDKPHGPEDKRIVQILTRMWVDFANTGDPTPTTDDVVRNRWTPVTSEDMEFYHIDTDVAGPVMKKGLFQQRSEFWRTLPLRETNEIKDEL